MSIMIRALERLAKAIPGAASSEMPKKCLVWRRVTGWIITFSAPMNFSFAAMKMEMISTC